MRYANDASERLIIRNGLFFTCVSLYFLSEIEVFLDYERRTTVSLNPLINVCALINSVQWYKIW